nr:YcxB family protein [uncultured Sphaerochaeta sp.]
MEPSTSQKQPAQTITVCTYVDADVYTTFSRFNNFTLNHRSLSLKLFPVLMLGLGTAHLFSNYLLWGTAFILLGGLLPLGYVAFHRKALANQIERYKLDQPRLAYTVHLGESEILIHTEKERASYPYAMCYGAYQVPGFCYLYLTKAKCFILPAKDIQQGVTEHELFGFLQQKLGSRRTRSFPSKRG